LKCRTASDEALILLTGATMRIQTRLFLGTAALVLALMAIQWWIYARQLRSIEDEVTRVATTVGTSVLSAEREMFGGLVMGSGEDLWVDVDADLLADSGEEGTKAAQGEDEKDQYSFVMVHDPAAEHVEHDEKRVIRREFARPVGDESSKKIEWVVETKQIGGHADATTGESAQHMAQAEQAPIDVKVRKLVVGVEPGDVRHERFLVVSEDDDTVHRIPIPVSPAVQAVRETMREAAAMGGVLLIVGLVGSAVLSRRLTRPLRSLADGAEALGSGEFGVQVPVSAAGEVGDLQRAFNSMSARLAELEAQRERWQEREHLAQLGDLSRGLAHTLRNPLHTLGLAVEELASSGQDGQDLVATSRAQIRRIDRWLRSFLALGAEELAEPEATDLGALVRAVILESVQQGADVRVQGGDEAVPVRVVPGAVRAALSNLIENATEVSPAEEPVEVSLEVEDGQAVVSVVDGGPGLPEAVKERLFSPHVTTKVGGSGMGLFLARQLVVGMHGGSLEIVDGADGGTVATIRLPLTGSSEEPGDETGE
jgi:signal transduction histidine kinase